MRTNTGIELKEAEITLKLSSAVCYDIAYDLFHALQASCKNHWVNHPDVWLEHEKVRLARIKQFITIAGYEDQYEHFFNELSAIVKEGKKQS